LRNIDISDNCFEELSLESLSVGQLDSLSITDNNNIKDFSGSIVDYFSCYIDSSLSARTIPKGFMTGLSRWLNRCNHSTRIFFQNTSFEGFNFNQIISELKQIDTRAMNDRSIVYLEFYGLSDVFKSDIDQLKSLLEPYKIIVRAYN